LALAINLLFLKAKAKYLILSFDPGISARASTDRNAHRPSQIACRMQAGICDGIRHKQFLTV